ncbi:MAG: hypothetical protein GY929_12990 [Actinomycetia bacterium]|nr:hypothetical protein [Actinomycetes bacterium]
MTTESELTRPARLQDPSRHGVLRLPSGPDPIEGHLELANQADRDHSARVVSLLLPDPTGSSGGPESPLEVADTSRLSRLFDLDLLDHLIDHGLDRSRLGLSNQTFLGDAVTAIGNQPVHAAAAAQAVADGGRVVLTTLEQSTPGLRRLAEHLGRLYSGLVTIQAVAGAGAFSGQTSTLLAADHLIIPIEGHRQVQLRGEDNEPRFAGPLGPGQALRVSRGQWLASQPANEFFVHLEVRIQRPDRSALLALAAELPAPFVDEATPAELNDALRALWQSRLPTWPGTPFSLLREVYRGQEDELWIRPTMTGGWCVAASNGDNDHTALVAAGIALRVPTPLIESLAIRAHGGPTLMAELDADEVSLATLLVKAGLFELVPEPDALESWDHGACRLRPHAV